MQWKRWAAALVCPALLLFYADCLTVRAAPAISSLSAVVYEPESGLILYEKDARTARPMASTTKLMTALLAVENLDPNRAVTVPAAALPVEGTQIGLEVGEEITVRDLLAGLLLASGNDSASARDMALLGAAVLRKPLLAELCASKTATITVGGVKMTVSNHNKLLKLYDGTIGLKTGFTKKSGRCLVSAVKRDGVTLIVATLNGGDYWNDHMALYNYAFSLVHREPMPDVLPDTCSVAGGTADAVAIAPEEIPTCVLREGESATACVELPDFVWAPIAVGDVLGYVRYTTGERELARVPIRATASVAERELPPLHLQVWRWFCLLGDTLLK